MAAVTPTSQQVGVNRNSLLISATKDGLPASCEELADLLIEDRIYFDVGEWKFKTEPSIKTTALPSKNFTAKSAITAGRTSVSTAGGANRFPRVPNNSNYSGWSQLNEDNLPLLPAAAMGYLATTLRKAVPDTQHQSRATEP
ncbi:hypothetical protein C8R44DRAFT_754474 [Mycena epipterygia]|nr:hypothetical protein C8R44DRAFT_754474 [Mycena epipterygia]